MTENLCKIATVTGATKSGKTVLVKTALQQSDLVWVDGGDVASADAFWAIVSDHLGLSASASETRSSDVTTEMGAEVSGGLSLFGGKLGAKVAPKAGTKRTQGHTAIASIHVPTRAKAALKDTKRPVVIDDFHYLSRDVQAAVTRALKPLVFEGLPVVYLAIPHRRYDAIKVEKEMNGRIALVQVPPWTVGELTQIADLGFPLLNVWVPEATTATLAKEAHGSPHLMQEFCKKLCFVNGVRERSAEALAIPTATDLPSLFQEVARELGKNIFDKLAQGPRQRTDRKERRLKKGGSADIYRVVLIALAHLKPGVETIGYEPLRAGIREVIADDLPQSNEVARVLEHMARISASDSSSSPVIDYEKDEKRLHVTDPFFAFFLRWGGDLIREAAKT